jgi:hypothetical protein
MLLCRHQLLSEQFAAPGLLPRVIGKEPALADSTQSPLKPSDFLRQLFRERLSRTALR